MVSPLMTPRPSHETDEATQSKPGGDLSEVERALTPTPDVAAYLAHMTAEMTAMARAAGYDLLAYFLDMARIEAKIQADQARK